MVDAHINLGNIFMEMKNVGLALQCFQTALKHEPGSPKAKRCLETAQSQQKTARKETSPFGRLVNVADLDRQQHMTTSRILDSAARISERESVQKNSRIARTSAREMVATLEGPLPQQLHRLKIAILHMEEHLDATELLQKLGTSVEELRLQQAILLSASDQFRSCLQTSE